MFYLKTHLNFQVTNNFKEIHLQEEVLADFFLSRLLPVSVSLSIDQELGNFIELSNKTYTHFMLMYIFLFLLQLHEKNHNFQNEIILSSQCSFLKISQVFLSRENLFENVRNRNNSRKTPIVAFVLLTYSSAGYTPAAGAGGRTKWDSIGFLHSTLFATSLYTVPTYKFRCLYTYAYCM